MKERGGNPNQSNPELTSRYINPRLNSGDIFMANEGGEGAPRPQPKTPEETVDHLARVKAQWDSLDIGVRRALTDQEKQESGDLSRKDASTRAVINRQGIKEIHAPVSELTPERVEELKKLLTQQMGTEAQTPEQMISSSARIQEIMLTDPKNFPRLFTKAFNEMEIPQAEAKRILNTAGFDAVEKKIKEKIDAGEFTEESANKFRKKFNDISKYDAEYMPDHISKLLIAIDNEKLRIEKAAQARARKVPEAQEAIEEATTETEDSREKIPTFAEVKDLAEGLAISIQRELPENKWREFEERRLGIIESSGDLVQAREKLIELQHALDEESTHVGIEELRRAEAVRLEKERQEFQRQNAPRTPEELEDLNAETKRGIDAEMSGIMDRISQATSAADLNSNVLLTDSSLRDMLYALHSLENMGKDQADVIRGLNSSMNQIESIISSNSSLGDIKSQLSEIVRAVGNKYKDLAIRESKDQYNPVTDVYELGRFIASTHGQDLWGENGEHPIVDKEGEFHPENMIRWMREQTIKLHVDNRNDAISPLGSIHINTGFRDVSLYEMVRLNPQRYLKDKDGAILYDLADQMINESWGFGQIRNYSLAYTQAMNEDKKLPEIINQIHARNDLTHGDLLGSLLTMSEDFRDDKKDAQVGRAVLFANDIYYNLSDWEQLVITIGGEHAVSKSFTENMRQLKSRTIRRLQQEKNPDRKKEIEMEYKAKCAEFRDGIEVFTKGDFEDAIRVLQKKKDWEEIDSFEGFYTKSGDGSGEKRFYAVDPATRENIDLFDEKGNLNIESFVKVMNIYNYANPGLQMVKLVRELTKQKIAQKAGISSGIERDKESKEGARVKWEGIYQAQLAIYSKPGVEKPDAEAKAKAAADRKWKIIRDGERINLEFAETLAEAFQRPYGGGARNDVNRRGFDAMTKLHLEEYLVRQSAAVRAGPVGVREAVGIWRNLGPDMWTALKTETGYSPIEIFGKIRDIENDASLNSEQKEEQIKKWTEELKFNAGAEKDVAGNVQSRGFQIFHAQTGGERLELDKLVEYDPITGVKIHLGEWEEKFSDGLIKPIRYFGSTNGAMKWTSKVRRLDPIATKQLGVPTYEEVSLAEDAYSPEIITLTKNHLREKFGVEGPIDLTNLAQLGEKGKEIEEYLDYGEGRLRMVKYGLGLELGAQLKHHRKLRGHSQRWGYVRTKAFLHALEAMEELELDGAGGTVKNGKRFFDEEIVNLIIEKGDSKGLKLAAEDLALEIAGPAGPLWGALLEMFIRMVQASAK